MPIEAMRDRVKRAYSGKRWEERVKNMKPAQVIAVFKNLSERGKI